MPSIGISEFVKRQTPDSRFSCYLGSWEQLAQLVKAHFDDAKPGYRSGVELVPVPVDGFLSGVAEVTTRTPLRAVFEARRKGEDPYIIVEAIGSKLPAKVVDIVVYRKDVLESEGDETTGAEWDVISINARPDEQPEPQNPVSMARNFLGLPGGTKAEYTAEEFAKAIVYWSHRAMLPSDTAK